MKKLFLSLVLASAIVVGQPTPTLTVTAASSAPAAPGLPYTLNLSLSNAPTAGLVAVAFTVNVPTGWAITSTATALANKEVSCDITAVPPATANPSHCIVWGDLSVIANGLVATMVLTPPTSATTTTKTINLSFGAFQGVDVNGTDISGTAGPDLVASVVNFDLNADSVVSRADVLEEVAQVVGAHVCSNGDLTHDSNCKLGDLFVMINGWIAYGSIATP